MPEHHEFVEGRLEVLAALSPHFGLGYDLVGDRAGLRLSWTKLRADGFLPPAGS